MSEPLPRRAWVGALGDALLPSACALCGARCAGAVCRACHVHYLAGQPARCPRCANPVGAHDSGLACGACQTQAPAFDATCAAAGYLAPLDQLVLQLKFGGTLALAPWFAQAIGEAAAVAGMDPPDLLCPVPLGARRLAERGFNQALEIARPLARTLGVALAPALALRVRETPAQSGVAPAERRNNLRRAFMLAPHAVAQLAGRHIGVVDDVMTSGATLHELAALLKRFGAARVSNYVFARTPPH
jgi:ComF family protein